MTKPLVLRFAKFYSIEGYKLTKADFDNEVKRRATNQFSKHTSHANLYLKLVSYK